MAYLSFMRRACLPLLLSSALVACTADSLVPPMAVDNSARVSSIRPHRKLPDGQFGYSGAGRQQVGAMSPAAMSSAGGSQESGPVTTGGDEAVTATDVEQGLAPQSGTPAEGINMDAELGVGQASENPSPAVVGLAQEEEQGIAEGETDEPVVAGIGTDSPVQTNRSVLQRPAAQAELNQSPVPQRRGDTQVAMLPRVDNPVPGMEEQDEAPQSSPGMMPASEMACRQQLRQLGVVYEDKPAISKGAACQVPYPISLKGLSGNIAVKPAVTLNCQVTLAFAKWVKNELAPAARARYWSGIGTVVPLGGYSCRRMNNSRQRHNPMSEHAHGNAIDVGTFILKNGHVIDVRKKGLFSFREGRLLKAVRTDSCRYFDTVLGPGSNAEHWNHFHFDLRDRKGSRRYCSL